MSNDVKMMSAPRELLERIKSHCMFSLPAADYDELSNVLDQPVEQHQGEPIGRLMRDKHQNIVIVPIGDPHIKDGMLVYTHADPGEVERLREELRVEKAKGVLLDDSRINAEEAQWAAEHKLSERDELSTLRAAYLRAGDREHDLRTRITQLQADLNTRDHRIVNWCEQVLQKVAKLRGTLDQHGRLEEVEGLLWPDLHSTPEERGTPEAEPCSGCGAPGFTGNCEKCIPY